MWPAILWDWVWSTADEWLSSILLRFSMKGSLAWLGYSGWCNEHG
jgi:hypothetical protein